MIYPWFKAAHIFAMVLWMSGMVVVGLALAHAATMAQRDNRALTALRRWDRLVTSPSMLVVWLLGLIMAQSAGWWTSGWLQIKLALVFVLSGVHGVLAGRLRRLVDTPEGTLPRRISLFVPAILCLLAAVILLAVVKPS